MRFIKKLDVFILKNYLMLFAGTFCISLFVVMMQFLWKYVEDLVGKGLPMDVMAQFFFYAAETLVPLALPLAILLASLISFGNLGERLELLAIKAAGISLIRTLCPLIVFNGILACWSFYFQDVVAPEAQMKLMQLRYSMMQKSPELEIPEGVFYDGIEGVNLYVKSKNKDTGMLYNVVMYNLRDGVENAHIILADSGSLETSADKMHLMLHLYSGEQFENLRSNTLGAKNVPYRRETFSDKHFLIEFDTNFSMTDSESFSSSASTKNMLQLIHDLDSLDEHYNQLSRNHYTDMKRGALNVPLLESLAEKKSKMSDDAVKADSVAGEVAEDVVQNEKPGVKKTALAMAKADVETENEEVAVVFDSIFEALSVHEKQNAVRNAIQKVSMQQMDSEFKTSAMESGEMQIRRHWIQVWQKITMALACLVFFFIGAPLGAIIRKGGLGLPVVISVIIFIVYYIINTAGMKLGREGSIPVWFGMWVSTLVLAPIGIFFTVKSNNDSVVFNMDSYVAFFRKLWGIRVKRHIVRKEVIINDPVYSESVVMLNALVEECQEYRRGHNMRAFPNYLDIFFRTERDNDVERISEHLEACVEDLSNSKDRQILRDLNHMPVLDAHAHTAPFHNRKLNVISGVLFPVGIILLFRMAHFRRRLRKDLRTIVKAGGLLAQRAEELANNKK